MGKPLYDVLSDNALRLLHALNNQGVIQHNEGNNYRLWWANEPKIVKKPRLYKQTLSDLLVQGLIAYDPNARMMVYRLFITDKGKKLLENLPRHRKRVLEGL